MDWYLRAIEAARKFGTELDINSKYRSPYAADNLDEAIRGAERAAAILKDLRDNWGTC